MKILLIQTAFIGDVILATSLVERLKLERKECSIDFLLRKGNENILQNNPHIDKIIIYDKKNNKYKNLLNLINQIRDTHYDYVINIQRFFTTGLITAFSGARVKIGFKKNPLSFLFDFKMNHEISEAGTIHEVERNLALIAPICNNDFIRPKIYLSNEDYLPGQIGEYICIAPGSVWFTKTLPVAQWIKIIKKIPKQYAIMLLGSKDDDEKCNILSNEFKDRQISNMAGKLSLRQSAALISHSKLTISNDSAPLHLASAVNAPICAVFCSTVPQFGFGPLSDVSYILQNTESLKCRPCGLHGKNVCPEGHFKCSELDLSNFLNTYFLND